MNRGKVCYITHAKFLYGQKKLTQSEGYVLCTSFNNLSLSMFQWPSVVNCKEQRSFASFGCGNIVKYQTVLTPMDMSVTQAVPTDTVFLIVERKYICQQLKH